jgi:hypothetical protein
VLRVEGGQWLLVPKFLPLFHHLNPLSVLLKNDPFFGMVPVVPSNGVAEQSGTAAWPADGEVRFRDHQSNG